MPAVAAYAELAKRANLAPAALALAFVRSRWFCASTIIGATTIDQLQQDIDTQGVTLQEEILAQIDAIHLRYPNPAI
jgi:aryl-alcohol dehydrogenase (NADP+)